MGRDTKSVVQEFMEMNENWQKPAPLKINLFHFGGINLESQKTEDDKEWEGEREEEPRLDLLPHGHKQMN